MAALAELGLQLFGLYSTVTTNGVMPDVDLSVNGRPSASTRWPTCGNWCLPQRQSHPRPHAGLVAGLHRTGLPHTGGCQYMQCLLHPGQHPPSISSEGDGCTAFSLVSDVVFREYGHGINDVFYESLGGAFTNGAPMRDMPISISLSENPVLGGCFSDDLNTHSPIRREPQGLPPDLVGEVHADGEIVGLVRHPADGRRLEPDPQPVCRRFP